MSDKHRKSFTQPRGKQANATLVVDKSKDLAWVTDTTSITSITTSAFESSSDEEDENPYRYALR
ncbi:uncharacterized protein CGFF_05361 [Nakaseomyces glabratus]|nr:uncharacterized protein CGFF_04610 [Nakaseomyces glabratus]SLM16847.1 uncharacterized protein CGFF_05361 [Nakaseomyces glabratus]